MRMAIRPSTDTRSHVFVLYKKLTSVRAENMKCGGPTGTSARHIHNLVETSTSRNDGERSGSLSVSAQSQIDMLQSDLYIKSKKYQNRHDTCTYGE